MRVNEEKLFLTLKEKGTIRFTKIARTSLMNIGMLIEDAEYVIHNLRSHEITHGPEQSLDPYFEGYIYHFEKNMKVLTCISKYHLM